MDIEEPDTEEDSRTCDQLECQSQNRAIGEPYLKNDKMVQRYMECNCVDDVCKCERVEKEIPREPEIEPKPDLIIEDISWSPSDPEQGDPITFTVSIKNQGAGDATFFQVYYYIDDIYQDMDNIYGLPAGSTTTQSFTWTANKCGDVQVMAVADATDDVAESNESNNQKTEITNIACPIETIKFIGTFISDFNPMGFRRYFFEVNEVLEGDSTIEGDEIGVWVYLSVTIQPNPTITRIYIRDAFTIGFS